MDTRNKKLYLGIDIGGWKIRGVLWDGRRAAAAYEVPTPRTKAAFVRTLRRLVGRLSLRANGRIRGIGIGAAGVIEKTRVRYSPNIPYLRHFDFRTLFPSVPLRVDNDARAFVRAEWMRGAGKGAKRILGFTIGTGIGRAYGRQGRIVVLKKFEHPEKSEHSYNRIRDGGNSRVLVKFLGDIIAAISKRYNADLLLFGGGVLGRPGFLRQLTRELVSRGIDQPIRRARLGRNAGAIGAAMLFGQE